MSDQDTPSPPPLLRTGEEIEAAGRDLLRRNGWKLSQRQREQFWVLLRPYADRLLVIDDQGA